MKFGDAGVLLYLSLCLIGLIIFSIWAQRAYMRASRKFAELDILPRITSDYKKSAQFLGALFTLLAILLIGIALARPQWGSYWKQKNPEGIDILFVVDTSKSMLSQDVKPDRMTFAKIEIEEFTGKLKGDRLGLMAFAGDAFLFCPLTMDKDGFILALHNLSVESVPKGGTSISAAIGSVIQSFKWASGTRKVAILITDGEDNEGGVPEAAKEAKDAEIEISCIGIGTKEGDVIPYLEKGGKKSVVMDKEGRAVRSRLDEDMLKKVADATGGVYVRSSASRFGLDYIYDERLSGIKKKQIEETIEKSFEERFQIPLALALIAFLAEIILQAFGNEKD